MSFHCILQNYNFVTTPGSNFSQLCSFIYEVISGKQIEGLAGAINNFSRSDRRRELDAQHREAKFLDGDEYAQTVESDNFHDVHETARRLDGKLKLISEIIDDVGCKEENKSHLLARKLKLIKDIDNNFQRHGPFLVWAHQISAADHRRLQAEIKAHQNVLLEMDIAFGRLRRSRRSRED
jgi:hypothetical protein